MTRREARWHTQQPASEVLIAIPDEAAQRNLSAGEIRRDRCGARKVTLLPILGRRRVRIAGDCGLHRSRLLAVPAASCAKDTAERRRVQLTRLSTLALAWWDPIRGDGTGEF